MSTKQQTIDKYLLDRIVNSQGRNRQKYLEQFFEAVCKNLPYHTERLTWEKLHQLVTDGPSDAYWGWKWNIYTAYVITAMFDKNIDSRYRFVLENTLKDFPDENGKLIKCNVFRMQERLSAIIDCNAGLTTILPLNTDWELCNPSTTSYKVSAQLADNFVECYKIYINTLRQAQKAFKMGAEGKIIKMAESAADQPVFPRLSKNPTINEIQNKSATFSRLFASIGCAPVKYDCNYLLPLYGLNF